jgi:D-glycero-D-manno-heptose 1,7-bisphosphate phosphatase
MLIETCQTLGVDPADACFIGDSERDLEAARNAGCRPILVRTGDGRATERTLTEMVPVFDDLAAAVDALLNGDGSVAG